MVTIKKITIEFETTLGSEDEVVPSKAHFQEGCWNFEANPNLKGVVSSLLPVLHEVWTVLRNWTKDKNSGSTSKKN